METIASTTGGKYFRATDNTVLNEIFSEIDSLEKTAIDVRNFTHTEDNYLPWALLALLLLALELILRNSVLRSMP